MRSKTHPKPSIHLFIGLLCLTGFSSISARGGSACLEFIQNLHFFQTLKDHPVPLVISAPSGAGKTTLTRMLTKYHPDVFEEVVSTTTRPPRGNEKEGVDYYYTSKEDFQKRADEGEFMEWAEVHGNFYGSSRKDIEKIIHEGKTPVLAIDTQGAELARKVFNDRLITIFVLPPNLKVLEQRLRDRNTESEDSIQTRLKNAEDEMQAVGKFDHTIINDDLWVTYFNLINILNM